MNSEKQSVEEAQVTVHLLGKDYHFKCKKEEVPYLQVAALELDEMMKLIRRQGKLMDNERIAIMAALNIAHEFLSTRLAGSFDIGEYKRRMNSMQAQIDQAMADQDELF